MKLMKRLCPVSVTTCDDLYQQDTQYQKVLNVHDALEYHFAQIRSIENELNYILIDRIFESPLRPEITDEVY